MREVCEAEELSLGNRWSVHLLFDISQLDSGLWMFIPNTTIHSDLPTSFSLGEKSIRGRLQRL